MDRNISWIVNILILVIGLVFLKASIDIPGGALDSIGPRAVPLSISLVVVLLSLCLLILGKFGKQAPDTDEQITPRHLLLESGPLLLLVAVYGQFFYWFGYLASTFVIALIVFRLFSNSWKLSIANATAGSLVFYFAFIQGMSIYDPPGALFDFSTFLIN